MISTPSDSPLPTRRSLLATASALALGTAGCAGAEQRSNEPKAAEDKARQKHSGAHRARFRQRGISEPQPLRAVIAAFDLAPRQRGSDATAKVRGILERWSAVQLPQDATYTVALGPTLYHRLGLAAPGRLQELPPFPHDRLDPRSSGGDILVQLCGDDPHSLLDVLRRLFSASRGTLVLRWHESGFLPAHDGRETPRNLFGFKDGTENPDPAETDRWVFGPDGSTYLVYRRIHMDVPAFTSLPLNRQEAVVGRQRVSGAPLGERREHDEPDLFAKTAQGRYVVPVDAHVRLAHSRLDGGARMLRRGYSYDYGSGDQGLLFIAFMRAPALFVRVQERLDHADAMTRFVEHRASAVGYVMPAMGSASLLKG